MLQSSHTPPIPSPARLGISSPSLLPSSNPNIPKPPSSSSTPNHHHQQQQQQPLSSPSPPPPSSSAAPPPQPSSSSSSSTTALLPPLPRAQSLLLQMSSLASKLFESSPNRSLWSSSYRGSLPSFLPNSNSQSPLPPSSSTKDEILSLFHSLQTLLFDSVSHLQTILDLHDSTASLSLQISSLDSSLLSFARTLHSSHLALDSLLDDYSHYRSRDFRNPNLDLNDLLSYAHRISYTTFAPPDHAAGLAPLRGALPPGPQDNEMRASQLYHFADLDVGVPKAAAAAGTAAAAAAEVLMEATPPREEGPSVPMLPISVPPGWRKGMPVELPSELPPVPLGWKPGDPVALPPVPPGWKPGDPVPLPPFEGAVGRVDEVGRVPAAPKAPEAIQVKYVQLDINQDEDEYSSGYSSEVGSSDEEDDE